MFEIDNFVRYYETDQMGVVHHSNYVRYFELARDMYKRSLGFIYEAIEASGVYTVIRGVNIKYLSPVRYGDKCVLKVGLAKYNGIKYIHYYEIYSNDKLAIIGTTQLVNCDTKTFKPISLKNRMPKVHDILLNEVKDYSEQIKKI